MKLFKAIIIADRYPTEYTIQASSWPTAVARAVREWAKKFKGSRTAKLTIKIVKAGAILKAEKMNGEQ